MKPVFGQLTEYNKNVYVYYQSILTSNKVLGSGISRLSHVRQTFCYKLSSPSQANILRFAQFNTFNLL